MNQWEMQKYQLSTGGRGQVVRIVKQLLHQNPRNSYRMDGTEIFDAKLQAAVAEFQRTARLPNTSGTLDAQTWAALGVNLHPAQIKIVSVHDSNIESLLAGNLGGGRGLSADEIKLAQTVYKSAIDYTKVLIHKEKYFDSPFGISQPDNTFMTPNGEIYAPPNVYSSDYAAYVSQDMKAVFIHEMCHVWQWQRNIKNIKTEGIFGQVSNFGDYSEMYKYKLQKYIWGGTTENDLKEYALEQQAAIIEDYYRVILNNLSLSSNIKGQNCQNSQPLNEIKDLLKFVSKKFIADPSYLGS